MTSRLRRVVAHLAHKVLLVCVLTCTVLAAVLIPSLAAPATGWVSRPLWLAWFHPSWLPVVQALTLAALAIEWVCVIAIGRYLRADRARLDAPPALVRPRLELDRDETAFIADADFAALARGTTQT